MNATTTPAPSLQDRALTDLERLERHIQALRGASHVLAAAFETETPMTSTQVFCLLDGIADSIDCTYRSMRKLIHSG